MPRIRVITAALLVAGLVAAPAVADVWTHTDAEGVVHFTNVKPRGKDRTKWKRVTTGGRSSGKGAAKRGRCERCDRVPAKDHARERFSRYDPIIYEASALYDIPVPLIRAVIRVESDYDPRVVSSVGARGLMQLMPAAASDMGVSNVHDPRENILGGVRYLRILANKFNGDLVLTIAAYHSGPGTISRHGDVPPYPRVQRYVRMVLDRYYQYLEAEKRVR